MRWTERQRSMLATMGVVLPPGSAPAASLAPQATQSATAASPAPSPARAAAPAPERERRALPVRSEAGASANTAARESAPAAPDARAASIAALDWPGLEQTVAQCRACRLCDSRTHTVFGVGNRRAHWMIVGEAPGEQEDKQGEPFVGAAGHLLDRMLKALDLTRDVAGPEQQVYIANTLKCRPPRNRNPEPDELALCQPFLRRQVELVQPRVILAMGRFAVQSLLHSDQAIGRLRGQVHRWDRVPLVVTYHPAYLLRSPADKAKSWADLCLAASVLDD